jgi:hypothetical protein
MVSLNVSYEHISGRCKHNAIFQAQCSDAAKDRHMIRKGSSYRIAAKMWDVTSVLLGFSLWGVYVHVSPKIKPREAQWLR